MNGTENLEQIFRTFSRGTLVQVLMIAGAAWLLIVAFTRSIPMLADRVPGRFRFQLLALVPIFRLVVIVAAIVLVLNRLIEPAIENIIALLGLLGLGLGFAFKDYVSSLIAGVVTLYEAPYRPGDWIEVDGAYGEVRAINMRSVEIVTPDDTVVVIPHMKLWNRLLFNSNDGGRDLQCIADFYLHPRHDGAAVRDALYDVALTSAYLQFDEPVKVIVQEKPWGTHYRLKAYPVDPRLQFDFITDLTIRGKAALGELGAAFAAVPALPEAQESPGRDAGSSGRLI